MHVTTLEGDDTYESGFQAMKQSLQMGHRPDGLFSSNDLMGCGVLDALGENDGLSCPEDVMVIGYDNIPQSAWQAYQLSSFDQRSDAMAAAALDILGRAFACPDELPSETIMIEASLVLRRSTEKPTRPSA
nr:substrate-binding domain-containing protein [Asaia prunellae]